MHDSLGKLARIDHDGSAARRPRQASDFTHTNKLMAGQHFVRVGVLGSVGRFRSTDGARYRRGARVICRTPRGLEVGEVLADAESLSLEPPEGSLLRRMTVEDDLLWTRLEKNREAAFVACSARLAELAAPAVLVDVEHLFDGQSLFFYFLGEADPRLNAITAELASVYEAKAQLQKFADTLAAGCGPHCGTEEGGGCTSGGCSTCAVLGVCKS
jgi:hypothetical protein